MVCSICSEGGHTAPSCNSHILQESITRIKAYWLGENMPEGWTHELVKNWAISDRIGLPYWRRIWYSLRTEFNRREWWRIPEAERQTNPVLSFCRPEPRTVWGFRERIRNYIRPAVIPGPGQQPRPRPVPLAAGPGPSHMVNNVDREFRLLRQDMDQVFIQHLRRMNRQLRGPEQNKRKIGLVMDAPDERNYFDPVCAICMNEVTEQTVLAFGCKHTFCANCAIKTIQKTTCGCPTCRVNISEIHFKPTTDRETFNKLSTHISFS